jgi:hypothetical protein
MPTALASDSQSKDFSNARAIHPHSNGALSSARATSSTNDSPARSTHGILVFALAFTHSSNRIAPSRYRDHRRPSRAPGTGCRAFPPAQRQDMGRDGLAMRHALNCTTTLHTALGRAVDGRTPLGRCRQSIPAIVQHGATTALREGHATRCPWSCQALALASASSTLSGFAPLLPRPLSLGRTLASTHHQAG